MTERLWAPWRMEYIRGIGTDECFLCRMLQENRDRENLLLKRGRTGAVVLNRYPYNNGHLLVFPYRHVPELKAMTEEERREHLELQIEAIDALKRIMRPDGFNVGLNQGKAAGAGVEAHLHTHVVPRWNGDTNYMPVLADVKIIPQALGELWDALHPVLDGDP
ncbi:MAG: HIT domain-containing protein [Lentisphaerae bacterium]|nr:HIT domain-containing protein [Lentisphaerota bacterium]